MDTNGKTVAWYETEAGAKLQSRLADEPTLEALDHLLARIDKVEQAVDRLAGAMEKTPGMIAMLADMADETYRQADARGVSIDQRLKTALHLAEKLTDPAMTEKLEGLLKLADQVPGMVAMSVDMVDEAYRKAAGEGIDIDARLRAGLQLVNRLTAPAMTERLNKALDLADHLPGLVAMGVDILDEGYREAARKGLDLETLGNQGVAVLKQLSTLLSSAEFAALMKSGVLAPETIGVVAKVGNAFAESNREEPARVGGVFGLMRSLRDKDRQKALGFLMNFLKRWGQHL